jgi:inosine-uridine nucleoside N-ribohydrolase
LIFDTDIGDDIDDVLALALIHGLESRGECRLLAVTISKDYGLSAPFTDAVNTFYGRAGIPIGTVSDGHLPEESRYVRAILDATQERDGSRIYPRKVTNGRECTAAVALLRKTLAGQANHSVVIVMTGLSTNLARLLDSPADEYSPLQGRDLVAKKCRLLSLMGGMFTPTRRVKSYNFFKDFPSARALIREWPTEIWASGNEIGDAVTYPAASIRDDFQYAAHHPVREAYEAWGMMPYERPCWDLTSVLIAVRPDRDYFALSEFGTISFDESMVTQFTPAPSGRHRYLTLTPQQAVRAREAFTQLVSQPPSD